MNQRGFTLIELLAALAIFAMFALLAYGGLGSVLKTRAQVDESLARTGEMQRAMFRLQSDIEQVRNRPIRDEYGDDRPAFLVNDDDGVLEFTRGGWRNPRLAARSSFERVAYGVKDKKLYRYNWLTLDRAQDENMVETLVLDKVRSASWRFLGTNQDWVTTWPPAAQVEGQRQALPVAVELILDTEDWSEIRYVFRIVGG
jgi:general secretion pathway protein J